MSETKSNLPVHLSGRSRRATGWPTTVYVPGSLSGAAGLTFNETCWLANSLAHFVRCFIPGPIPMLPSCDTIWLSGTSKCADARPDSAWNAVAAARRTSGPCTWIDLLPAVTPWSGVWLVSPCTSAAPPPQPVVGAHHDAGDAIGALPGLVIDEGLLYPFGIVRLPESFNGGHLRSAGNHIERRDA